MSIKTQGLKMKKESAVKAFSYPEDRKLYGSTVLSSSDG